MHSKENRDRVLRALIGVQPPYLVHRGMRPDSCVAQTRIGIEVLRYFGLHAKAISITAMIYNGVFMADPQRYIQETDKTKWGEAWSVGLGFDPDLPGTPEGSGTHLGILLDDVLVDLTLPQGSRPDHGIELRPSAFLVPPQFARAPLEVPFTYDESGMVLVYTSRPKDKRYTRVSDWRVWDSFCKTAAGEIIRVMRKVIDQ